MLHLYIRYAPCVRQVVTTMKTTARVGPGGRRVGHSDGLPAALVGEAAALECAGVDASKRGLAVVHWGMQRAALFTPDRQATAPRSF